MNDDRPLGRANRPAWKRVLFLTLGWAFLALGIAGFFLPVLQGVLFTVIGLYLLAKESAWARLMRQRLRRWAARRFPESYAAFARAEISAHDWIDRRIVRLRPRATMPPREDGR